MSLNESDDEILGTSRRVNNISAIPRNDVFRVNLGLDRSRRG